jgi:uncharacterized protein YjbJ (UPF0337 family)
MATLAVAAALAAAGCGDEDTTQDAANDAQERVEQAEGQVQEQAGAADGLDLESLTQQTEEVVGDVRSAAERLAEDPGSADVEQELQGAQERAEELAAQAREWSAATAQDAEQQAGQQAEQRLTAEQRAELGDRLAQVNEEAASTAGRLREVTDPQEARRIVEERLSGRTDELRDLAEQYRDRLPSDVREQLEGLAGELR